MKTLAAIQFITAFASINVFPQIVLMLLCNGIYAQNWTNLDFNPDQPGLQYNQLKGFAIIWNHSNAYFFHNMLKINHADQLPGKSGFSALLTGN